MTGSENDFKNFCTDFKGELKKIELPLNKLPKTWQKAAKDHRFNYKIRECTKCKTKYVTAWN
jgi:hypothetical protein